MRARAGLALMAALLGAPACDAAEPAPAPTTDPRSISIESPFRYPETLWDTGVEGESVVMVHVTDAGGVDSVYVLQRSEHPAFDSAAVAGAYELRFAPGRRGDERVAMWVRLPVRFRIDDRGAGGVE